MGGATRNNDHDDRQRFESSSREAVASMLNMDEGKRSAAGDGAPLHSSGRSEGLLAALSTMIDENLSLFRAGTATMVVGSALTISLLVYRRGLHGFVSAAQVPASYFNRRKRVRVRIAKVVEAAAVVPHHTDEPKGGFERCDDVDRGNADAALRGGGDKGRLDRGSDLLLHTEHVTVLRRVLRLPPRSLGTSGGGGTEAATFTLRLCGVAAEEQGVLLAHEELVKPLAGHYCDAELLFREQRSGAYPSPSSGVGDGTEASSKAFWPVAVCHVHRRRGVLWRDIFQSRLDPKAGFGEHLISEGLARLREEQWWTSGYGGDIESRVPEREANEVGGQPRLTFKCEDGGGDPRPPFPALERLLDDRDRFVAAERGAKGAMKGVWGLTRHDNNSGKAGTATGRDRGVMDGLKSRSVGVVRATMAFFSRWPK